MESREPLESGQFGVRCALMSGGSSKGVSFVESDRPPPCEARDRLRRRITGTPDVMQIDGLGGIHGITSRITAVGPPARDDADVDCTFARARITRDVIDGSGVGRIARRVMDVTVYVPKTDVA